MTNHARTAHAVRMADSNRTTVDVKFRRINAQGLRAVQHLAGKGFVDFPQADVIHAQPVLA
ncbi:hypothetical protein D3C78_897800 [compost metagenome]